MNETINNILTRRSIRKFTDQMVSKEDLDIILASSRRASIKAATFMTNAISGMKNAGCISTAASPVNISEYTNSKI